MPYKKSPAKKPLVGKQKNLPKELKEKILKSPATKMKTNQDGGSYTAKNPSAAGKQLMKDQSMATMKKSPYMMYKSPSKMNSYDKDMMHERELIYDAKKQEKTGSKETKSDDKKLIADAKNQIHNEDVAKKKHIVNEIAGRNSRMV